MIETFPPIFSAALLYYIEVQHIIVEKLKNNLNSLCANGSVESR